MDVGDHINALAALPRERIAVSVQSESLLPLPEYNPRTVQPVASRYIDYAIPALNAP